MPTETFFNLPKEKRARLLDILLDEFSQNDYKNVSIGRVAERAGIAKGSFYQYFADKKDCYLYLIQLVTWLFAQRFNQADDAVVTKRPPGTPRHNGAIRAQRRSTFR